MALFDRLYTTFYWSAIVNIARSCTVFEFFWRWIISWSWNLKVVYGPARDRPTVDDVTTHLLDRLERRRPRCSRSPLSLIIMRLNSADILSLVRRGWQRLGGLPSIRLCWPGSHDQTGRFISQTLTVDRLERIVQNQFSVVSIDSCLLCKREWTPQGNICNSLRRQRIRGFTTMRYINRLLLLTFTYLGLHTF